MSKLREIKRQREVCAPQQHYWDRDPLGTSGFMGVKGWKYKICIIGL